MGSDHNEDSGMSRRDFASRLGAAAAGIAVGGDVFGGRLQAAPAVSRRILGANDRVVVASIGIRGQGNGVKRGFAKLDKVEIKTLCDIDANLAPERVNDPALKDVASYKPGFVQDLHRVLDDKDIDAIIIATPNHWHALATIRGLMAGKHVYVEKPASHTVWEGRKMVEAAARYNKVVQVGTMNRSKPAVRDAIKFVHEGGIGKVYMARGLCYKRRASIGKYPDGPMGPDETYKLNVESARPEPPYYRTVPFQGRLRHVARAGSKAAVQPQSFPLQLALALGLRQRRQRQPGAAPVRYRPLGFEQAGASRKIQSSGGYFGPEASQETPDTLTSLFEYADGTILEFATRGEFTNDDGGQRIGNLFYGTKGWVWIDGLTGAKWQSYLGTDNEKGPGADGSAEPAEGTVAAAIEFPHYQNFIDAVRAGDAKLLNCDIVEGHYTSTLPHLGNIAYQVGHSLVFDGKKEAFVDDKKADELLTREYRKGFEIPKSFT